MALLSTVVSGGSERGLRVHLLSDPAAGVWVESSGIQRTRKSKSEVKDFAGGKRKVIAYKARTERITVQVWLATVAAGDAIEDWVDNAIVVRDERGKVYSGLLDDATFDFDADLPADVVVGSFTVWLGTDDGEV